MTDERLTIDYKVIGAMRDKLQQSTYREYVLRDVGAWVVQTCLLFGTSATTAYKIAALMVEGIEQEGPR